jgi:CRISPR/Cas system-associated protein Cas10 (large subunit of type III CRISPR-Cas system)
MGKTKYIFEEKPNTHIVMKRDDVKELDLITSIKLDSALRALEEVRKDKGKEPNPSYIVVNLDEPYADTIMGIIKQGEEMKHYKRTCRVCGCDDLHSCKGGCHWVEEDLCSFCHAKSHLFFITVKEIIATKEIAEKEPVIDPNATVLAEELESQEACDSYIAGYMDAKDYKNIEHIEPGNVCLRFDVFNHINEAIFSVIAEDSSND